MSIQHIGSDSMVNKGVVLIFSYSNCFFFAKHMLRLMSQHMCVGTDTDTGRIRKSEFYLYV